MKTFIFFSWVFLMLPAAAHDEPTSFIDLRLNAVEIEVAITASVTDLAHDLRDVEPGMLLDEAIVSQQKQALSALVASRLKISGDGGPLEMELREITPVPEKRDLHMVFSHRWTGVPVNLRVEASMFPYDPRHQAFVNVYAGHDLLRQDVLTAEKPEVSFRSSSQQGLVAVIGTLIVQGMHHIFIGPDHILFVVGLILLGGTLRQLLKIVTAFTVAHSVTLCLATFRIITPPASFIEPVIALSIVFVGVHAFFGSGRHDPRLWFAFGFGLIHGFGFANVLQEMVLPREALGWSLFAFNFGVEIGQGLIVLVIAPMLVLFRRAYTEAAGKVVSAGALAITVMGAFWFFERVIV